MTKPSTPSPPQSLPPNKLRAIHVALLILITRHVFFNSLGNGFNYDDSYRIVNNPEIHYLWPWRHFLSVPHGFTGDRREFLGREAYPDVPAALKRWGLAALVEPGHDPCAALQVHLDIGAGEAVEVLFLLGEGKNGAEALDLVAHVQVTDFAEQAFRQCRGLQGLRRTPAT